MCDTCLTPCSVTLWHVNHLVFQHPVSRVTFHDSLPHCITPHPMFYRHVLTRSSFCCSVPHVLLLSSDDPVHDTFYVLHCSWGRTKGHHLLGPLKITDHCVQSVGVYIPISSCVSGGRERRVWEESEAVRNVCQPDQWLHARGERPLYISQSRSSLLSTHMTVRQLPYSATVPCAHIPLVVPKERVVGSVSPPPR